jgi:hypothetical protein
MHYVNRETHLNLWNLKPVVENLSAPIHSFGRCDPPCELQDARANMQWNHQLMAEAHSISDYKMLSGRQPALCKM